MIPGQEVLRSMLKFPITERHRRMLRKKLGAAQHDLSDYYRSKGDGKRAWRNHLSSLVAPEGLWRYGAYTRKLLSISASAQ